MKKLLRLFFVCVLALSVAVPAFASPVTEEDFIDSVKAYEALYCDVYEPLYASFHATFDALTEKSKDDPGLQSFLGVVAKEYRAFYGYRDFAGGVESMSRFDVPAARGLMYASSSAEDFESAIYYCDEVLVPLIDARIGYLRGAIDDMENYQPSAPEPDVPAGPEIPVEPETPEEPEMEKLSYTLRISDALYAAGYRFVGTDAQEKQFEASKSKEIDGGYQYAITGFVMLKDGAGAYERALDWKAADEVTGYVYNYKNEATERTIAKGETVSTFNGTDAHSEIYNVYFPASANIVLEAYLIEQEEPAGEDLVTLIEKMNAVLSDTILSWNYRFESVDSTAPMQDRTKQVTEILDKEFGAGFFNDYSWSIVNSGNAYVIYLTDTDVTSCTPGEWVSAVKYGSTSGNIFSGEVEIRNRSKELAPDGDVANYPVMIHVPTMQNQEIVKETK